jgi:hypothetical protein
VDHHVQISFAFECSAVRAVVAEDIRGSTTAAFLREVLWLPALGLSQALGAVLVSLVSSGRVTESELETLAQHSAIQGACRLASPVLADEVVDRLRRILFPATSAVGAASPAVDGLVAADACAPRPEQSAQDLPRKRGIEETEKPPKSDAETRMKKIRRVLK